MLTLKTKLKIDVLSLIFNSRLQSLWYKFGWLMTGIKIYATSKSSYMEVGSLLWETKTSHSCGDREFDSYTIWGVTQARVLVHLMHTSHTLNLNAYIDPHPTHHLVYAFCATCDNFISTCSHVCSIVLRDFICLSLKCMIKLSIKGEMWCKYNLYNNIEVFLEILRWIMNNFRKILMLWIIVEHSNVGYITL
jgi:hypothetical protein